MIRPPPTSPLFPYTTLFRSYLNVSVMMTLSGVVGVNEKRFRTLTEEVFGRLPDDLEIPPVRPHRRYLKIIRQPAEDLLGQGPEPLFVDPDDTGERHHHAHVQIRSEERRVGKERGRRRWSDHSQRRE